MKAKILGLVRSPSTALVVYVLASIVIPLQHYWRGTYDNYRIFARAFGHLATGQSLYAPHPGEYSGRFLYHPTFAVLFAPFSWLPDLVGLVLWVAFSSWLAYYSIGRLPVPRESKLFIWWFSFVALTTALHNAQTNPVVAASVLLSLAALVAESPARFGLFSVLGFFVKVYGGAAAALVFQSRRLFWRNVLSAAAWFLLLSVLPGFFVGFQNLPDLYREWWAYLQQDHAGATGSSLIGLIRKCGGSAIPTLAIQAAGILVLLGVLGWTSLRSRGERDVGLLLTAYLLMWMVLFNHKAEANTHFLSVVGVALWYVTVPRSLANRALAGLVFVLTGLAPTDLMPRVIRLECIKPYALDALPITLVWLKLHLDLYRAVARGGLARGRPASQVSSPHLPGPDTVARS